MIETLEPLNLFAIAHINQWRGMRFELSVEYGV